MTFEELYGYILLAVTSASIFVFAVKILGLRRDVLVGILREFSECIGASIVFFLMNIAVGAFFIFVIRRLGQFVALYAVTDWDLLVFSVGQGFLFQMWWRRSRGQPSSRKSATSGK